MDPTHLLLEVMATLLLQLFRMWGYMINVFQQRYAALQGNVNDCNSCKDGEWCPGHRRVKQHLRTNITRVLYSAQEGLGMGVSARQC